MPGGHIQDYYSNSVPFGFFVSLVEAVGSIKPRKASNKAPPLPTNGASPAVRTLQKWIAELHKRYAPLPAETTGIVFRLLFPEEDVRRKYGMQETRIAQYLSDALGVSRLPDSRGQRLAQWKGEDAWGCLGIEVRDVMDESSTVTESNISIAEVDTHLTRLAATCAFSDASVRQPNASTPPGSKQSILRVLYAAMTPAEACVLTQVILKDLRPLLYPVPKDASHYTAALLQYNSNAVSQLNKWEAMRAWDPSGCMLQAYRVRACLGEAALAYERRRAGGEPPRLQVGIPIQIPKCVKGQGCAQALKLFHGSERVWVETKYDGERAQIHVEVAADPDCPPHITIFSKSGRDSTLDRHAIHPIICDALGIPHTDLAMSQRMTNPARRNVAKNIILEAEMVAYSDSLDKIDEFWRIRSLIASTAVGVRHTSVRHAYVKEETSDTQCSMASNASDDGTRHLALVFFDVLLLDDTSLLSASYSERRAALESVINIITGYSMLAERIPIHLMTLDADALLRKAFARLIADREEGVILKADESRYNERRLPWVKLKKDYIPGYGDTLDLVLIGAVWEKDRARQLSVPPTAYTTFYLGALANGDRMKDPEFCPHFEVFFTVSYGLTREKLEELNFIIKNSDPVPYLLRNPIRGLSYTYNLFPAISPPAVLLQMPVLTEVFGAGFTKAPQSKFYDLRFPRISKIFRLSERSWMEGTGLQEFQSIAREAVGRDRPGKDIDDWCNELWGKPTSPGVSCPKKRKIAEVEWEHKLALVDHKENNKRSRTMAGQARADGSPVHRDHGDRLVGTIRSPAEGPSRALLDLKALKSVTNIAQASDGQNSSSPASVPVCEALSGSDKSFEPCIGTDIAIFPEDTAHALTLEPQSDQDAADKRIGLHLQYLASPPPSARSNVPSPILHADTTTSSSSKPNANMTSNIKEAGFLSPELEELLADAVIWLARSGNFLRPSWRAPSHQALPDGQLVHGLESFLQACGWSAVNGVPACDWARRGVVFVDDSTPVSGEDDWTSYPMKALLNRRASLAALGTAAKCKPIWVCSMQLLNLRPEAGHVGLKNRVICKFG